VNTLGALRVPSGRVADNLIGLRELQGLLGKKTLEMEILREALDMAQPKNGCCARRCGVAGRDRGNHHRAYVLREARLTLEAPAGEVY
jgi:hypothetical protein